MLEGGHRIHTHETRTRSERRGEKEVEKGSEGRLFLRDEFLDGGGRGDKRRETHDTFRVEENSDAERKNGKFEREASKRG